MFHSTILDKLTFNKNIECSNDCKDLLKNLLTKSPKNRLGAKMIL